MKKFRIIFLNIEGMNKKSRDSRMKKTKKKRGVTRSRYNQYYSPFTNATKDGVTIKKTVNISLKVTGKLILHIKQTILEHADVILQHNFLCELVT